MMQFPSITLACVDGRSAELAQAALDDSSRRLGLSFGDSLIVTAAAPAGPGSASSLRARIEVLPGLTSIEAYSACLIKELHRYVRTDHVLIVQWDGFVLDPARWLDEFLQYDYVGAHWPWFPEGRQVGNGGFSLRSRRLLEALRDPRIQPSHPEDAAICVEHRELLERSYGIRFAPVEVADRFSFETKIVPGTYGFHGFFNFHRVFSRNELARRLAELPSFVFEGLTARMLAAELVARGDTDNARLMLRRILAAKPGFAEAVQLAGRLLARNDPCLCGSARRFKSCCGAIAVHRADEARQTSHG
jgi:hypothetical protein